MLVQRSLSGLRLIDFHFESQHNLQAHQCDSTLLYRNQHYLVVDQVFASLLHVLKHRVEKVFLAMVDPVEGTVAQVDLARVLDPINRTLVTK